MIKFFKILSHLLTFVGGVFTVAAAYLFFSSVQQVSIVETQCGLFDIRCQSLFKMAALMIGGAVTAIGLSIAALGHSRRLKEKQNRRQD